MLPRQPELQSNQPNNLMQSFPLPDDALHEIKQNCPTDFRDILL